MATSPRYARVIAVGEAAAATSCRIENGPAAAPWMASSCEGAAGRDPAIRIRPPGAPTAATGPRGATVAPDGLCGREDGPGRSPGPSTDTRPPSPPGQPA